MASLCPRCGASRGTGRYCPHCAFDFWSAAEELPPSPPASQTMSVPASPVSRHNRTRNLVIGGVILAVLGVIAYSYVQSAVHQTFENVANALSSDTGESTTARPSLRASISSSTWYPSTYKLYVDDASIAWRFRDKSEYSCSFSGASCSSIEVIAKDGCTTLLYAEVSILDSSGAAIGFSNDVAGSLTRGQHAKLVFDILDDAAASVRLTDVSCY